MTGSGSDPGGHATPRPPGKHTQVLILLGHEAFLKPKPSATAAESFTLKQEEVRDICRNLSSDGPL